MIHANSMLSLFSKPSVLFNNKYPKLTAFYTSWFFVILLTIAFIMKTTTISFLTIEQCQCLLQVWERITNTLIFAGQAKDLSHALKAARTIHDYDHATINHVQSHLAKVFTGASVSDLGQLPLSHFINEISITLPILTANNQQDDGTSQVSNDQRNHASTDILETASICPLNERDSIERNATLCKLCTCGSCRKRHDRAKKKEKVQSSFHTVATSFLRHDLFDILDKYWSTLQLHGLFSDKPCEDYQWSLEINSHARRQQYHIILRQLENEDELHPWRRFVAEYKTLEGYNEFRRETTRQKFSHMQTRATGENDKNRANKEYVKYLFPDHSPQLFSKAKAALKNDLQFARRWAILIDGFVGKEGSKVTGLGRGIFLVHGPEIRKKMYAIPMTQNFGAEF